MNTFVINGRFLEDRIQGITRYAREIIKELDRSLDGSLKVILAVPPSAEDIPKLQNIKTVRLGKSGGMLWEQITLGNFLRRRRHRKFTCINLCNITPFFVKPGITTIHDIMYRVNPGDYTTLRNKISRLWHCLQYRYITMHERVILTDSKFSKREIQKYYPAAKGKVCVVYCAWEHTKRFTESSDWNERFPFLKKGEFVFSLATLSRNKNGKWIMETAKRNPNTIFAVGGKRYETEYTSVPENVHLLGFISDEDVCSLMKNCKAFVFPSLYEGFGLPPLEALALNANSVIVSDIPVMHEIYGKAVHYIDPHDPNINVDDLIHTSPADRKAVLDRLKWKKSAEKLLHIMRIFPTQ